jgi:hypothetical protein
MLRIFPNLFVTNQVNVATAVRKELLLQETVTINRNRNNSNWRAYFSFSAFPVAEVIGFGITEEGWGLLAHRMCLKSPTRTRDLATCCPRVLTYGEESSPHH